MAECTHKENIRKLLADVVDEILLDDSIDRSEQARQINVIMDAVTKLKLEYIPWGPVFTEKFYEMEFQEGKE